MDAEHSSYFEEGAIARLAGKKYSDCPYYFINSPCWANKDYKRFNTEFRPKMDEWCRGWDSVKRDALRKEADRE